MHASLFKARQSNQTEKKKLRLKLLTVNSTKIVNASEVLQPLIGDRVRHLQQGCCSLMKSAMYDFLANKSISEDGMIFHHSGICGSGGSWRHPPFPPNVLVKNELQIKCSTFCPMLLS